MVRHYPVLNALPPRLTKLLHEQGGPVDLPAGTIAFEEDSSCSGLILITRGSVRVVRSGPDAREIMLYRVRPGESCILSGGCLLGRTSYPARGVVETNLAGVHLPGELVETLIAEFPAFRTFLFELFGPRLTSLLQLVEEVGFHRLDQRLATLLLRRFKEAGGPEIAVTHQGLADEVGSVRENVSRLLASFENEGAIALGRGRLRLLRPEILGRISGAAI